MLASYQSARFAFHLAVIAGCILGIFIQSSVVGYNQTNCPQTIGQKWPSGKTVYYSFTGLDSTQQPAVIQGISDWNTANQSNGSNVRFVQGPPPAGTTNPSTITFRSATQPNGSNSIVYRHRFARYRAARGPDKRLPLNLSSPS